MPENEEQAVFSLLDEIENLVESARTLPMTGRVLVDRDELLGLLGELRHAFPRELGEARWLLRERDRVLSEARARADQILAEAQERLEAAAREHEVYRRAEELAGALLGKARKAAQEIRDGADAYADEVLAGLEAILQKSMAQVGLGRRELADRRAGRGDASGEDTGPTPSTPST